MPNIASASTIGSIRLKNSAAPSTPPAGFTQFFAKSDKTLHFVDDAGNDYQLATASHTAGAAPQDATYIVISTSSLLANERYLLGTANQITVTDGGAGAAVTLSLPQSIATASAVVFGSVALNGALISGTVGTFRGQYVSPEVDNGTITGTTATINWNSGNEQTLKLSNNVTLTFSNPTTGGRYVLILEQDSTGSRTVSWPTTVRWPAGVTPTLVTTGLYRDLFTFLYTGGLYLGNASTNYST